MTPDRFDSQTPPLLDTLASNARTALDDPAGIGLDHHTEADRRAYAIRTLDEIIDVLNPAVETRATFAATLTILGRHLAERQDVIEAVNADDDDPRKHDAIGEIATALDALDVAIATLTACDYCDGTGLVEGDSQRYGVTIYDPCPVC